MRRTVCTLFCASLLPLALSAAPLLTLTPSNGVVSGLPGSTVGWGFTITNTTDFLVVTGSSFAPVTSIGTYQDYIGTGANLVVVGPAPESTSVSQAFSVAGHTGVGAFLISSSAPSGVGVSGTLTVNYSLFSRSPNDLLFDPDTDTIVPDASLTQGVAISAVPEPSTLLLLTSAIPVAGVWRRRKRRS